MEITHSKLLNNFLPAFNQIGSIKTANSKLRYAIKKTAPAIDDAVDIYNAVNKERLEAVATKDESGKVVFDEKKEPVFPSEEIKKAFYEDVALFAEKVITIDIHSVSSKDLEGVEMTSFTERDLGEFITDESEMKAV